jgi:hypothetical protein
MVTALLRNWRDVRRVLHPGADERGRRQQLLRRRATPSRPTTTSEPSSTSRRISGPSRTGHRRVPEGGRGRLRDGVGQEDDRPPGRRALALRQARQRRQHAPRSDGRPGVAAGRLRDLRCRRNRTPPRRACSRRSWKSFATSATARSTTRDRCRVLYEFPRALIKSGDYKKREMARPNPNMGARSTRNTCRRVRQGRARGQALAHQFRSQAPQRADHLALRADSWAGARCGNAGGRAGADLDEILDRSEVVTMGIDGGGLDDLLGIAVIGREKGTKRWLWPGRTRSFPTSASSAARRTSRCTMPSSAPAT